MQLLWIEDHDRILCDIQLDGRGVCLLIQALYCKYEREILLMYLINLIRSDSELHGVGTYYDRCHHAAQPNEGHKLIKDLEKDFDVTVITQNVDNLHEKAGSKNVIHLHGELSKVCSSRDPYDYRYIKELPENDCEVEPGTKAGDGSLLRPFIVFFGESVPMIEPAAEAVQQADIFVIIGTSLNVYPAAGLIAYTKPNIPIYLIDPGAVNTNGYYKIKLIGEDEKIKLYGVKFFRYGNGREIEEELMSYTIDN